MMLLSAGGYGERGLQGAQGVLNSSSRPQLFSAARQPGSFCLCTTVPIVVQPEDKTVDDDAVGQDTPQQTGREPFNRLNY
jgi:hypothetical protein